MRILQKTRRSLPSLPYISDMSGIRPSDWQWAMENINLGYSAAYRAGAMTDWDRDDLRQFVLICLAWGSSRYQEGHESGAARSSYAWHAVYGHILQARKRCSVSPDRKAEGIIRRGRRVMLLRGWESASRPPDDLVFNPWPEWEEGDFIADDAMKCLPILRPQRRDFLVRLLGLGVPSETMEAIAKSDEVTKQRVSQVCEAAIQEIRELLGYDKAKMRSVRFAGFRKAASKMCETAECGGETYGRLAVCRACYYRGRVR